MKAEYKRDLQNNYLILEAAQNEEEAGYGLRMAEQNKIRGLLPMHSVKKDGKLYFHYEITSRQPLLNLYETRKIKSAEMLLLFSSLSGILEEMQRYLLSPRHLVFDPEMIYMEPDRKGIQLCYFPEENYPVTLLAEFLLKKLDHEDPQAVSVGYQFYQQAAGENFSLTDTLQEILKEEQQNSKRNNIVRPNGAGENGNAAVSNSSGTHRQPGRPAAAAADSRAAANSRLGDSGAAGFTSADSGAAGFGPADSRLGDSRAAGFRPADSRAAANSGAAGFRAAGFRSADSRTAANSGAAGFRAAGFRPADSRTADSGAADFREEEDCFQDEYQVIHHDRKKKTRRRNTSKKTVDNAAQKLFSVVHPAVLISALSLTVILELLLAFGVLGMTETGGCFFLALAVGMLANRFLLSRRKKNPMDFSEEEAEEAYGELLEEMYAASQEEKPEPIEETRCLVPQKKEEGLWLVYQGGNESGTNPTTIEIGRQPVCVGKSSRESDVVLECSTVSRTHAKLERKGDTCIVKDLNSKNGTFLNGKRLLPQEEAVLREGDSLIFAEVKYRVMRNDA